MTVSWTLHNTTSVHRTSGKWKQQTHLVVAQYSFVCTAWVVRLILLSQVFRRFEEAALLNGDQRVTKTQKTKAAASTKRMCTPVSWRRWGSNWNHGIFLVEFRFRMMLQEWIYEVTMIGFFWSKVSNWRGVTNFDILAQICYVSQKIWKFGKNSFVDEI